MKTLKFEGYSDDTFGEYGWFDEDIDNCASMKPIQCLITSSEGRLLVVGQYAKTHISGAGCWVIGVSMADEDVPIPDWPVRIKSAECGYSPRLEIDVPDDVAITFYNNGMMVEANEE